MCCLPILQMHTLLPQNLVPPNPHQYRLQIQYAISVRLDRASGEAHLAIPALNLDGDDLEEYSTVLLRLQNQVETGDLVSES